MGEVKCPNPKCGAILKINFSEEERKGNNGKDVVCPTCNGVSYIPAGVGKPIFFPNATDQYGRPRELRC